MAAGVAPQPPAVDRFDELWSRLARPEAQRFLQRRHGVMVRLNPFADKIDSSDATNSGYQ
jgi:hypothetical protein